jgi:hypothetical protein
MRLIDDLQRQLEIRVFVPREGDRIDAGITGRAVGLLISTHGGA